MERDYGLTNKAVRALPISEFDLKLEFIKERTEADEYKRRHEFWMMFTAGFFAQKGGSKRPYTREDYKEEQRQQKTTGDPFSAQQWNQQQEAAKTWDLINEKYQQAALNPYYWEELMAFSDHVFDEPEPPKVKTREEIREEMRELDRLTSEGLMASLEKLTKS